MMSAALPRDRILLVDDEPQVLIALEDLLSEEFVVLKSGSAEEALNVAQAERDIAVIVTDQRMPKMSGDELLTQLDGLSQATRILVTGFADLTAVVRAVNEGRIFAYVAKPWQPDDLRLKVHRAAEHFRLAKELEREKRLLHDLMDNVPDGIFFKDAELRYLRVNRPLAMLVNRGDDAGMVGKRASDFEDGADARATEAEEQLILRSGEPLLDVEREYRSAGLGRWFSESKAPIRGPGGDFIGLVGITRDVTLRKAHQARIARLTRIHAVMSRVNAAIVRTRDRDELFRETCRIAVDAGELPLALVHEVDPLSGTIRLLCAEPSDHPYARLLESEYDAPETNTDLARILELKGPRIVNNVASAPDFPRKKDLLRHGFASFAALPLMPSSAPRGLLTLASTHAGFFDNEETSLLGELADNLSFALDHIGTSQRLDFLAYHDGLTGLPNRDLLLDRTSQLIGACRRDGRKLAVVLVDIGRFRQVNETLGRRGGDELLVLVSQRLLTVSGDQGTVARFDANTFALLVCPVESEAVVAVLVESEILAGLKDSFVIDGTELRISARVGISFFPSDGDSPEVLVANADTALKKAKVTGQPYLFYTPTMNARVAEQLALETRLRRAVESDEFLLHYQPKVDLKSGIVVGLEALIRWNDPASGLVPPGKFIPVLEETGLIRVVGGWVLEHAAAQYRAWKLAGFSPPRIAVNVSAIQLAARDFAVSLERTIERYPDASAGIDLEITESVFVDDLAGSIEKLALARKHGLSVAIDDFGTGYSSLSYLGRLPIDALKIDRSFVVRMADDSQSTSIVTTIISLAHSLDLKVIAEGVETPYQSQLLRLLKCDQAQGFLVSRPVPADDVVKLFDARFNMSEPPKP
jgi:diguanylate cyclase (GGDEF)-like protein/PAS domain S-box-containing protein